MQKITSTDLQEGTSSVVVSFPRKSTIDRRRIDLACKASSMYIEPQVVDTASSFTPSINFPHIDLFEYSHIVNFSSLQVICPSCNKKINLSSLADSVIHQNHHPRIGVSPPTTYVTPCPNPKCSEIPFPHYIDHVLMIHKLPSLENEEPHLKAHQKSEKFSESYD